MGNKHFTATITRTGSDKAQIIKLRKRAPCVLGDWFG